MKHCSAAALTHRYRRHTTVFPRTPPLTPHLAEEGVVGWLGAESTPDGLHVMSAHGRTRGGGGGGGASKTKPPPFVIRAANTPSPPCRLACTE